MGAEFLASPIVLLFTIMVVFAASSIHYSNTEKSPLVSAKRLLLGYGAVVLCCAAIVAVSAYVSPEEALAKWHVPAERYWTVQIRSFLVEFMIMSCFCLVGVALIGLPVIFLLSKRGFATVPYVLLASIIVSASFAVFLAFGDKNPSRNLAFYLRFTIGQHILLALCFCLAIGLPWHRVRFDHKK